MPSESKPNVNTVWASSGAAVVPDAAKQALGWIAEIPDYDDFNGMIQQISRFQKHVNQEGIPVWDAVTPYFAGGYAKGNGTIYVALQDNTGQALPASGSTNTYWADLLRGAREYAVGAGTQAAHTATFIPALPVFDGVVARFKPIATNLGAATFNGSPIVGGAGLPLQGGEMVAGGLVSLIRLGGNWLIMASASGAVQVPIASQSNQAVPLGQLQGYVAGITPGRLLAIRVFTSNVASYTPLNPAATGAVRVRLQAGGGGGGGAVAPGGSGMSMGAGGGAGAYAEAYLTSGFSGVAITLPPGGIGGTGGIGATAATASFGALLSCPGGIGGGVAGPSASGFMVASAPTSDPTGGVIANYRGVGSDFCLSLGAGNGQLGKAGASVFGPGGPSSGVPTTPGSASPSPGAGGGGTALLSGASPAVGGQGGGARCIVEEYSN